MKIQYFVILAVLMSAGCDPFDFGGAKAHRQRLENEQQTQRTEQELTRTMSSLREYAQGKLMLAEEQIKLVKGRETETRADVDKLMSRLREFSAPDADGKQQNPETRLLRILKDRCVNELARKYLAVEFAMQTESFVVQVRDARVAETRYQKALAQNDAIYADAIKQSRKWHDATKEQRDAEIVRLQREIGVLESRRSEWQKGLQQSTRKTLVGNNTSQERERTEKMTVLYSKVGDLDSQIETKRRQIDFLRNPTASRKMMSHATDQALFAQQQANAIQDRNLQTLDRHFKPKATVSEIVAETSRQTIEKLQSVLSEKVRKTESALATLNRKSLEIRELSLSIGVSSVSELKILRQKLDKIALTE